MSVFFCLKAVHSFDSDVPPSSAESRGGPGGSGGNSILVASTRRCVGVLESTNTAPFNLKYYISMKGIAFTYHLACINDH